MAKNIPQEKLDSLFDAMCEVILTKLKEELDNPGITKDEIRTAKKFAEMDPDSKKPWSFWSSWGVTRLRRQ